MFTRKNDFLNFVPSGVYIQILLFLLPLQFIFGLYLEMLCNFEHFCLHVLKCDLGRRNLSSKELLQCENICSKKCHKLIYFRSGPISVLVRECPEVAHDLEQSRTAICILITSRVSIARPYTIIRCDEQLVSGHYIQLGHRGARHLSSISDWLVIPDIRT